MTQQLQAAKLKSRVLVDCSHGNSGKDHTRQKFVIADLCQQLEHGDASIFGVMLESNLVAGQQGMKQGTALQYGQSITDACIDLNESEQLLEQLANAVIKQRDAA